MKNLKNTLVAIGLVVILGVGAISAKAEMINSDGTNGQCSVEKDGVLEQFADIINGLTGIIIFDTPTCTDGLSDSNRVRWS